VKEDWEPHLHWLQPKVIDPGNGKLILPHQSYVIRTRHQDILIDGCVGNDKDRPERSHWHRRTQMDYLDGLTALGLRPEDIEIVMCTHLHSDHVGWNTRLVNGHWVPTFPNAKYHFSRAEFEFWHAENEKSPQTHFVDSILPVEQAGNAVLVENDFELEDSIWLEPTPGHTPDHYAIHLSSNGKEMVMSGDLIHCPVQCLHPDWRPGPDIDPVLARQTRRAFLERYCETNVIVCTAHFPLPSAGYVLRQGDGFRFECDNNDW
jgi:glyoxylase-like metal-dependent hydrolase (beta-lactamase superfamily II)